MTEEVLVQLIAAAGAALAGAFALIRYAINQSNKREQAILDIIKGMQSEQFDYYATKNGHMERMAKEFTNASNKMSRAVSQLATQVALQNANTTKPKNKK